MVLGESPPPGTHGHVGLRVNLRFGPRPRGCGARHFHVQVHAAGLDVWTEVLGDPHEPGAGGFMLEACAPPAGAIVTVADANDRELHDLHAAGHVLAFIETQVEEEGSREELVAFALDRSSTGPGCEPFIVGYRNCLLREVVEEGGPQPPEPFGEEFAIGLAGYAFDTSGDIAWIQEYQSSRRALYIVMAGSKTAVKVAEGGLGDVALGAGELTWTADGVAHEQALAALAQMAERG